MSGVIMADGRQWECCNECGSCEEIQNLVYEEKSEKYPYGRDLCRVCAKRLQLI